MRKIKRFRIVLDGVAHEVEVEELDSLPMPEGAASFVAIPVAAPAPAPVKAAPAPAPVKAAAPAETSAGDVTAPLQGTVLSVAVTEGQSVTAGQLLVVIEAMKMENEIVAPADGVVAAIHVGKGASVAFDDKLVTLR